MISVNLVTTAQNLLTQNPSFETYTNNTTPVGWTADEAIIEIVMDATDGSVGLKLQKDPNATGLDFRVATDQFINLDELPLSLKFDYKVLSGDIREIGFIMFPESWEFASNASILNDNQWHTDNYADMATNYIGSIYVTDYLNIQVFHETGFVSSEVIIDNLAFGYVGTLGNENFTNAISQDVILGPNPTNSTITFFNLDLISNKNVKVYDLNGKLVLETELESNTLDLTTLKTGVYILHLDNKMIKKIIKK